MTNFDTAFSKISDLVKDFKQNEKRYLSHEYQEAEVRRDFIDKFFEALGWDIFHNTQKNPWEQEVKVEKGLNVGRALKRADYAFYITPNFRDPKFYAEAKKPSKNLKNVDDYFQTVRYGWNANTPIAVLTDFDEFHIIDCRNEPQINNIFKGFNQTYHYSDYLNQEKFSEIYYLLSRDFVYNGSIEKYVDNQMPKPRGSASKRSLSGMPLKSIDESFLEFIDDIRLRLAKAFKKNDANLDSNMLTEATQKTIDRLVFIRFLEDKLIEPENIVSEFGSKYDAWNDFIYKSKELNTKYNGIVFKKHFIDDKTCIGPERKAFESICESISHKNSKYDFNAIPIHILGSIYERFLGKIVNATPKQVKVEEKPEVRKAGGVYYTPKYIVDYIVDNTIGKILRNENSNVSSPKVRSLHPDALYRDGKRSVFSEANPDETKAKDNTKSTQPLVPTLQRGNAKGLSPDEISKLRFADIACGSGSFLIGAFDCLLEYHNKYYQSHPAQAKKDGCIDKDGQMILSIKQKQKILLNNIYGVDIDPQAVEVTQLSLALKMLEDETLATANEMQVMFHEQILPDMTKNIVCGNSLIGTDILSGNMFVSDEERKLNPMDFVTTFPQVFSKFPPLEGDKGGGRNLNGFDAIIGNPPYVNAIQLKELFGESTKKYLKDNFATTKGTYDLYIPFFEKAIKLTKYNGIMSFITPNKYLSVPYAKEFRKFISNNYILKEISDLSKIKVFDKPSVYPVITIIQNAKITKEYLIQIKKYSDEKQFSENKVSSKILTLFPENIWGILLSQNISILEKCFECSENLINVAEVNATSTAAESDEFSKYITENKSGFHKIINTGTIDRYSTTYGISYFANQGNKMLYPVLNLKKINIRRKDLYLKPKIIFAKIALRIEAFLDDKGEYASINTNCIYDLKKSFSFNYLTAILNSNLLSYIYGQLFSGLRMSGGYYQFQAPQLRILPIKCIDPQIQAEKHSHDKIVQLVDQMLEAKKQLQKAKTDRDKTYYERKCDALDKQIDSEVYKLYNLTEEEIKIVEGKA